MKKVNAEKRKKKDEQDRLTSLLGVVMEQGERFPLVLEDWIDLELTRQSPTFRYLKAPLKRVNGYGKEVIDKADWLRFLQAFMSCSECRAPMMDGQKVMAFPYWDKEVEFQSARNYCRRCTLRFFEKAKSWMYGDK